MITFDLFKRLMAFDARSGICIEIFFRLSGSEKFDCCWMGKLYDKRAGEERFWFGLTPDGSYAFDYPTFEEFATAPVFDGKSLLELWDNINIEEINSCDPTEMIEMYLSGSGGLSAPR